MPRGKPHKQKAPQLFQVSSCFQKWKNGKDLKMQKTITLPNGVTLGYNEFGSGDRYLISCQQNHNSHIAYTIDLAEKHGFHLFQVQIRGYGAAADRATENHGGSWYDVWADDAVAFADAMGIDRFFYGGISHGSGIGWTIARRHPERMIGFFAGVPGPHPKDGKETGEARMMTINASKDPVVWKDYASKKAYKQSGPFRKLAADGIITEELAEAAYQEQLDFWVNMTPESAQLDPKKPFSDCPTEETLIKELEKITIPTLIIGGMQDPISTIETMVRSCKAVKGSEMVIFEDGSHNVLLEHRAEVVDHIMSFCRGRGLI